MGLVPRAVARLRVAQPDEPWIVGDAGAGDSPFGAWPGLVDPRVAYAVRDWTARLALVAAGLGVAVVPGLHASVLPPGVALIEVDEPIPIRRSAVAVTRPDRTPSAAALIDALRHEGAATG
ncbi:LysR substrate-binding domain-containing protein [Solirubrobacter soli]|uniref:LysR substrate-binding domain-containing protein n=1 Tax=Solirubrobacter soli TaxID=363832 RepID=UPI0004008021|nr:LysR substrate-binding domain-containing protein [Solirubrobacter soli]